VKSTARLNLESERTRNLTNPSLSPRFDRILRAIRTQLLTQTWTRASAFSLTVCLLALSVGGCASNASTRDAAGPSSTRMSPAQCRAGAMIHAAMADDNHYLIRRGDELALDFYMSPEFNDDVVVRPDGKVSLRLVGDLQAADLTPPQLADELDQAYSTELRSPNISVHVKNSPGRRVYVEGEVTKPGAIMLQPGMTTVQAIAEAGGLTDSAGASQAVLIRRDACGSPQGASIDLDQAVNKPDHGDDMALLPSDILVVPRSKIANVGLFVKQYIRDLLPVQPYAGATAPL
jgi:polysaccharide export outer membrane protein